MCCSRGTLIIATHFLVFPCTLERMKVILVLALCVAAALAAHKSRVSLKKSNEVMYTQDSMQAIVSAVNNAKTRCELPFLVCKR